MSEQDVVKTFNTSYFLGEDINEDQMAALTDMFNSPGWKVLIRSFGILKDNAITVGMNRMADEDARAESRHTHALVESMLELPGNVKRAFKEGAEEVPGNSE